MKDPLYHYTIIPDGKEPIQDDEQRQPFFPDELRKQLMAANNGDDYLGGDADPVVLAHYFLAGGSWDWYAIDGVPAPMAQRPDDFAFYGWVIDRSYPQDAEIGFFLLSELLDLHSWPYGLPVERELIWKPTPLSEVKKGRR